MERLLLPPVRPDGPIIGVNGRWSVGEAMFSSRPLANVVSEYIAASEAMHPTLDGVDYRANDAFRGARGAKVVAVNTLAPAQEAGYIDATLAAYASLDPAMPQRVLLYCNWQSKQENDIGYTLDRIEAFQREKPHFPLAYAANEVPSDTTIALERMKANAIALESCSDSTEDDFLILHHDGDLVSMNASHFSDLYHGFRSSGGVRAVVNPIVRHDLTGQFQNIDTMIAWGDYILSVADGYYGLGVGVSARAYMASLGFDPSLTMDEVNHLVGAMCEGDPLRHPGRLGVSQAELVTSPRRVYDKIREWSDSYWPDFKLIEDYRTQDITQGDDIGPAQLGHMLRDKVTLGKPDNAIKSFAWHFRRCGASEAQALAKALYMAELGRLTLGGPDDLLDGHYEFSRDK